jgi:hypothetical protein
MPAVGDRKQKYIFVKHAVPWLRRLVTGLSPRRTGFDPGPAHVRYVVDEVALGQVAACSSSSSCYSYQKDRRAKSENLSKERRSAEQKVASFSFFSL